MDDCVNCAAGSDKFLPVVTSIVMILEERNSELNQILTFQVFLAYLIQEITSS